MSDINAVPSSTEPVAPTETLPPSDNAIEQEAGTAAAGEQSNASGDTSASAESDTVDAPTTDASSHLSLLDAMLAEIERKVGAGIHLFAHEVTAARDHLAKLL